MNRNLAMAMVLAVTGCGAIGIMPTSDAGLHPADGGISNGADASVECVDIYDCTRRSNQTAACTRGVCIYTASDGG